MFATFSKCVGKRYFCGWQYSVTSSISICAIPAPRKGFSSTLKRERWVTACSCQYKWWERKTTVPERECDVTMFFGDGCCVVRGSLRKANMKFSQNTSVEVKISCVRVLIKTCHTLHSLSGGFLFRWCRHLVQQHLVYILVAPHTHTAAHQTSFASSCLWSCSLNWANAG